MMPFGIVRLPLVLPTQSVMALDGLNDALQLAGFSVWSMTLAVASVEPEPPYELHSMAVTTSTWPGGTSNCGSLPSPAIWVSNAGCWPQTVPVLEEGQQVDELAGPRGTHDPGGEQCSSGPGTDGPGGTASGSALPGRLVFIWEDCDR
jgi:hypothetical protein